tara:strand:- start:800 stop:1537 length:738 start_codon:yes stop_codon:yes gene_type:complete
MKDVRLTTWSHSSYSDIWPMYFGQLKKCAPFLKQSLFVEKPTNKVPPECTEILNNENDAYYRRFLDSLEEVEEAYMIYMQEDFVLYNKIDITDLQKIKDFLSDSPYSFVRLMKSGVEGGEKLSNDLNIFEIPNNCPYIFACNATMWKKKDFIKLYDFFRPVNILNAELYGSHACRNLNMKGCYVYNNEPKRGNLHYDSNVFPYMSSALHGGSYGKPARWLTSHYENELNILFEEYNIDPSIRGTI